MREKAKHLIWPLFLVYCIWDSATDYNATGDKVSLGFLIFFVLLTPFLFWEWRKKLSGTERQEQAEE
jgi:hypothetical protein